MSTGAPRGASAGGSGDCAVTVADADLNGPFGETGCGPNRIVGGGRAHGSDERKDRRVNICKKNDRGAGSDALATKSEGSPIAGGGGLLDTGRQDC